MRGNQTATLLRDGRVLVTGGIDGTTGRSVPTAELYDPATNTWALAASMAGRRNTLFGIRLRIANGGNGWVNRSGFAQR